MSEKIIAIQLEENISKNPFYSCPGDGAFELNSFHLARHLTSDLVPGARHLTNTNFKSSNALGLPRGGMLKFQIDQYISKTPAVMKTRIRPPAHYKDYMFDKRLNFTIDLYHVALLLLELEQSSLNCAYSCFDSTIERFFDCTVFVSATLGTYIRISFSVFRD